MIVISGDLDDSVLMVNLLFNISFFFQIQFSAKVYLQAQSPKMTIAQLLQFHVN